MNKNQNQNVVDFLKLIFSFLVITIHVAPFSSNGPFSPLNDVLSVYLGRLAVPFFFTASGYFCFRKFQELPLRFSSVFPVILRFMKLYLLWTVIYLPFIIPSILFNEQGAIHGFILFCRNLVLITGYTHLWYLNAAAFAIALIAFLLQKLSPKLVFLFSLLVYIAGLLSESWFGLIRPLENALPPVWSLLKLTQKLIVTSQNGLFRGFLFVSIGMLFAYGQINLSRQKALIGTIVSFLFLVAEILFVTTGGISRGISAFFCHVPTVLFLFAFALRLDLKDRPAYPKMRRLSTIIYFIHCFVLETIDFFCRLISVELRGTSLRFLLTLLLTLALSFVIMTLSGKKKFSWINKVF